MPWPGRVTVTCAVVGRESIKFYQVPPNEVGKFNSPGVRLIRFRSSSSFSTLTTDTGSHTRLTTFLRPPHVLIPIKVCGAKYSFLDKGNVAHVQPYVHRSGTTTGPTLFPQKQVRHIVPSYRPLPLIFPSFVAAGWYEQLQSLQRTLVLVAQSISSPVIHYLHC